jgi:hypothetical protein
LVGNLPHGKVGNSQGHLGLSRLRGGLATPFRGAFSRGFGRLAAAGFLGAIAGMSAVARWGWRDAGDLPVMKRSGMMFSGSSAWICFHLAKHTLSITHVNPDARLGVMRQSRRVGMARRAVGRFLPERSPRRGDPTLPRRGGPARTSLL